MSKRARLLLSAAERAALWKRWRAGDSVDKIARGLGRYRSSVYYVLDRAGGYTPTARRRARQQLTLAEREEISRGVRAERSLRAIAAGLGRAASTVSRGIRRNGGSRSYRAGRAESAAWGRGRRPKRCLLERNVRLRHCVARGLQQQWSPEQIARRLERQYPNDHSMRVSHETIYRSLFVQTRGALKRELLQHLRTGRLFRRSRHASPKQQSRARIIDAVSISQRPAHVEDRAVPGHWEGDLILGRNNSYVATLVERHSRFVLLAKVPSKETRIVVKALSRKMLKLPAELRRSLTWDRGLEMAHHKQFTIATDVKVYFCDPHSPWQRGSNENTNGLLRQYFPKGSDLSVHSQAHLNAIAKRLNQRPRETLNFRTPAEKFSETVALIG
jgi:IS30 family transposase